MVRFINQDFVTGSINEKKGTGMWRDAELWTDHKLSPIICFRFEVWSRIRDECQFVNRVIGPRMTLGRMPVIAWRRRALVKENTIHIFHDEHIITTVRGGEHKSEGIHSNFVHFQSIRDRGSQSICIWILNRLNSFQMTIMNQWLTICGLHFNTYVVHRYKWTNFLNFKGETIIVELLKIR
jgi:hypothetical protein